mmetsp:Transcript_4552/g.11684  ORF Transcript_4552/g.11684 Transcript_4552/m.11684 type:complete len:245 (-) Transcript_4552:933-1667(-)
MRNWPGCLAQPHPTRPALTSSASRLRLSRRRAGQAMVRAASRRTATGSRTIGRPAACRARSTRPSTRTALQNLSRPGSRSPTRRPRTPVSASCRAGQTQATRVRETRRTILSHARWRAGPTPRSLSARRPLRQAGLRFTDTARSTGARRARARRGHLQARGSHSRAVSRTQRLSRPTCPAAARRPSWARARARPRRQRPRSPSRRTRTAPPWSVRSSSITAASPQRIFPAGTPLRAAGSGTPSP